MVTNFRSKLVKTNMPYFHCLHWHSVTYWRIAMLMGKMAMTPLSFGLENPGFTSQVSVLKDLN